MTTPTFFQLSAFLAPSQFQLRLSSASAVCPWRNSRTKHLATMRFFSEPKVLNEVPVSSKPIEGVSLSAGNSPPLSNDAVVISGQLKGAIQRLYAAHITEEGVDYNGMSSSEAFADYVKAASRLPDLDVISELPDDAHKIAFYVNLYNAATQHGIAARGPPPSSSIGRLQWGMRTMYKISNFRLSLHEMENGILRKNRRISVIPPPFTIFDSRRRLCVDNVDPRIHFVLNCAANSCPPVLFLTVDNLEETLVIAARGFISSAKNFCVRDGTVFLSMIFKWYKEDFAADGSDLSLLRFVHDHGDEKDENIVELGHLIDSSSRTKIEWETYDWGLNSA